MASLREDHVLGINDIKIEEEEELDTEEEKTKCEDKAHQSEREIWVIIVAVPFIDLVHDPS